MDSPTQITHRKHQDEVVETTEIPTANGHSSALQEDRRRSPSNILRDELSHLKLYSDETRDGKPLDDLLDGSLLTSKPKLTFCSLKTPWQRRLQTLVVAWHVASFLYVLAITLFAFANPFMWVILIPYLFYYSFDRTPANGDVVKRYSEWFRSLGIWDYYCNYYPIHLHKTVDLKPTFDEEEENSATSSSSDDNYLIKVRLRLWPLKFVLNFNILKQSKKPKRKSVGPKYIFGYHPHGVAALGAFGAFATEGCGWSELFPNIPVCLMTLVNQFQIPFHRDYLLSLGITSVAKKNALKVLEKDYSICIVVGGAQESLLSKIGSADLVLKKRKGFIKLALETGNVGLVPCYSFGETDCYNILKTTERSYLHRLQLWVKENYGFTIPLFFARGLFNYDFGLVPFRKPINIVVGRPIYVEKKYDNPSIDDINHYQKLYITELERIFNEYKGQFGYGDLELNYVE